MPLPDRYMPYNVRFRFTRLECIATGENGPAEPYVWIFFYKIDGQTFEHDAANSHLYGTPVVRTHVGNAIADPNGIEQYASMKAGDIALIPVEIGEWSTRVEPIRAPAEYKDFTTGGPLLLPGLFGFVVAVMEQDTTSRRSRAAAHKVVNENLPELMRTYITETPTGQLANGIPAEQINSWTEQIKEMVIAAAREDSDVYDFLDVDDQIALVHVNYVPGPNLQSADQHSLDGHVRSERFWPIGVVSPADDTEEKRDEKTKHGIWYLGAEYDVDRANIYIPLGEAVGVKVYDGDAGNFNSLLLDTSGRVGSRSTANTPNGMRNFVTHRFDSDELGILNNAISSVDVPAGYKVVLYESPGFTGRTMTLDRYGGTGVRYPLASYAMPSRPDRIPRLGTPVETWSNRVSSIEVVVEDVSQFIH